MLQAPTVFAANAGLSLNDPTQPFVLAVEKDYPPFLFYKDGIVQGIAFEYTKLIAQKLGKKLEMTEPMQLQALLDTVKAGGANLLADITKTSERDEYLEFSDSYVEVPAVVIGRSDPLRNINRSLSGAGIRIAIGKGYGVVSFLKEKYPNATFLELDSDKNVVESVAFGASDFGVLDSGSLTFILKNEPLLNIDVLDETGFSYYLSFAVREGDKDFIPTINKAIAEITPKEREAIYAKWMPNVFSGKSIKVLQSVLMYSSIPVLLLLIVLIWGITLQRSVYKKTKLLKDLNAGLDAKVQEKISEFEKLQLVEQTKTEDLEKTKKAVLNILEDVQEEKIKLAKVTERLSLATKSAHIGVLDWDITKDTLQANEEFYQLYNATEKDFEKAYEGLVSFLHPDNKARVIETIQMILKGKENQMDLHIHILTKDAASRYLRAVALVQRDSTGRPIKLTGVQYDETKEKEIETNRKRFEAIFRDTNDAIYSKNLNGIVMDWNEGARVLYGYTEKEMVGKSVRQIISPGKNDLDELLAKIKKGIRVSNYVTTRKRKDGALIDVSLTISPLKNDDGEIVGASVVARDITKEKQIDKAKTEFVSLASHQLRTPLTAIRWYSEMLLNGDAGDLNVDQKQFVHEINEGNLRMVDLVNALLNVSRLELGTFLIEPVPTDVIAMTNSVIKEQALDIKKKRISFSASFGDHIPLIPVDEKLLRMVIQNLLSNAVKYTPDKGTVSLSLKVQSKTKSVLWSVSDSGYGIPKNQQHKIFEKLFRADNVRAMDMEGTGLGLYIVKQIVDQSGGKVWFESEENKGTTFFVELPLSGMVAKEGTKSLM